MILQYLLLVACALILAISCLRAPKNAPLVHVLASPMWAVVALTIFYGWEAAAILVCSSALLYFAVNYFSKKFASRAVNKLLNRFYKSCHHSLRHFANSAWWFLVTGPLMLASAVRPRASEMLSKHREKRKGGGRK